MNIEIRRIDIPDNHANEVTSSKILRDKKATDEYGNTLYHEDGIFSRRIFGQYGKCSCKLAPLTSPGICPTCGTRVLHKDETPDYYISLKGLIKLPAADIDFSEYASLKRTLVKLLNYEGFLYDGNYVKFDIGSADITAYDDSKVLIGKDAVLSLGVSEQWYEENTYDKIYIPHPRYRKIIVSGKNKVLGAMNEALVAMLKQKERLLYFKDNGISTPFTVLASCQKAVEAVNALRDEFFNKLGGSKNSAVNRGAKGQNLTGAIRATIINGFDIDEDEVVLGKYFIRTMYPELYAKHTETDDKGKYLEDTTNIAAINEELRNGAYYVLFNRPPTISEKSILALKPVFSDKESEQFIAKINPLITTGANADFDGDTCLHVALYSAAANKDAEALLPSRNYLSGQDGKILNCLPEDFVYTMRKAIESGVMSKEEAENLDDLDRKEYSGVFRKLGSLAFSQCDVPTVYDIINQNSTTADEIAKITGKKDDLESSRTKADNRCSEEKSRKFMRKVIASNIDEIANAGYFYKKLAASCDNMRIVNRDDCGSEGKVIKVADIKDENDYIFRVKHNFVTEFDDYSYSYDDFLAKTKELKEIHVRSFLTCKQSVSHKTFCKKCAGKYIRGKNAQFTPRNIGLYSTLMITEKATQASLDSMNKGESKSVNEVLEANFNDEKFNNYDEVVKKIEEVINQIGFVGVKAKYYEVALLSRFFRKADGSYTAASLQNSFTKHGDKLGTFIYQPTKKHLEDLLKSKHVYANSIKSKIMLGDY